MGGWNLPDNTWDGDPDAPWNQSDEHCSCCPADDDSGWMPDCIECEGHEGEGTCYLYISAYNPYVKWNPELNDFEHQWWRPVLRLISPANLLWRVSNWLAGFKFLQGLHDSSCTFRDEPPCECDQCDCGPDYDDRDDD
jgi:hypothetical protein